MARRFARENFTSGRRRRLISSSMLKPPIVAERLAKRHTPHSWTSFRGFQSFHFRYGSNTCLRRIEVWHRAYPICDAPGFRVRRGQPSLSFRNRGVITVLTCEQNCPIRYGFRASTPPPSGGCMAYFLPHVRWHESSFILHAGSMPVVGSSCLDKLVMNFHYFKKNTGFSHQLAFHTSFFLICLLWILNILWHLGTILGL